MNAKVETSCLWKPGEYPYPPTKEKPCKDTLKNYGINAFPPPNTPAAPIATTPQDKTPGLECPKTLSYKEFNTLIELYATFKNHVLKPGQPLKEADLEVVVNNIRLHPSDASEIIGLGEIKHTTNGKIEKNTFLAQNTKVYYAGDEFLGGPVNSRMLLCKYKVAPGSSARPMVAVNLIARKNS